MKPFRGGASAALAAILVAIATGCADPYASPTSTTPAAAVPGEQPARPLSPQRDEQPTARRLPATAEQAVRQAARLASSWTAATAAANQARLAAISVDAARQDALQAAARLPTDPQLAAGHASSIGTVAAVTLRPGNHKRAGLVVTHERLTVAGAAQERWRVTLATAVHIAGRGWAISRWQPQE